MDEATCMVSAESGSEDADEAAQLEQQPDRKGRSTSEEGSLVYTTLKSLLYSVTIGAATALVGSRWWAPVCDAADSLQQATIAGAGSASKTAAAAGMWISETAAATVETAAATVETAAAEVETAVATTVETAAATAYAATHPEEDADAEISRDVPPVLPPPGVDKMDLVLQVSTPPKKGPAATAETVEFFMQQSLERIFKAMAQGGWDLKPMNPEGTVVEALLPAVHYPMSLGAVRMPRPQLRVNLHPTGKKAGDYAERGVVDLVVMNGDKLITVDLNFPFKRSMTISVACRLRAHIGWEGNAVVLQGDAEAGFSLPKVPGLRYLMESFAKAYLGDSLQESAETLALGADKLAEEAFVAEGPELAQTVNDEGGSFTWAQNGAVQEDEESAPSEPRLREPLAVTV